MNNKKDYCVRKAFIDLQKASFLNERLQSIEKQGEVDEFLDKVLNDASFSEVKKAKVARKNKGVTSNLINPFLLYLRIRAFFALLVVVWEIQMACKFQVITFELDVRSHMLLPKLSYLRLIRYPTKCVE